MKSITFADVENALAKRRSVFTENEESALKLHYGLCGERPLGVRQIAKQIKTTRQCAIDFLKNGERKVAIVLGLEDKP